MDTKEFLQGDKWLDHPLHPALVSLPIGAWIVSLVMDVVAASTNNKCAQDAADTVLNIGLIGAGASAITGLAEYVRVPDDKEVLDTATNHGLCNFAVTSTYAVNSYMRASRKRSHRPIGFLPKLMSAVCVASVGYTGWLGGKMVYKHGVSVRKEQVEPKPIEQESKQVEKAIRPHV